MKPCPQQNKCKYYLSMKRAATLGCCLSERKKKSLVCAYFDFGNCLAGEEVKK